MALVMSTMPDVWRKVLAEHLADERGRCRACRNANGETATWPCQTYRVAQEAKWVAEGNLPGTGPHGSHGPSATPRLSPLDEPRGPAPSPDGYGAGAYSTGAYSTGAYSTGAYNTGGHSSGGHDLGGSGSWEAASWSGASWDRPAADTLLPGSHGASGPGTGGWSRPGTGGWDLPGYSPVEPPVDDAATAFGGGLGTSGPALASLPPLPPSTPPEPPASSWRDEPSWRQEPSWRDEPSWRQEPSWREEASWRDEPSWRSEPSRHGQPSAPQHDPWREEPRRSSWLADESAPYGSRVDAPYGSTFGVDDRPRSSGY